MKTVDIVIPVHNSVHWLSWCLEELFRFKSNNLRKVFIINDHSSLDQSKKLHEIVAQYKGIEVISNEDDESGFGYACNLASSRCTSDIILFLNTDCLVTEDLIDRLSSVFDTDSEIALACPLSNNSSNLTYPILSGFSYHEMASLLAELSISKEDSIIEACTIVGNCLMVRRDFFKKVNGFSSEWGIGYGEETDLHMKAISQGLKGVVHIGCYVYHYGGGTFNYKDEIESHREKNYQLFMSKWSKEYKELAAKCENIDPTHIIDKKLEHYWLNKTKLIELDVLFYLPGIDQGIGGVNAVIAICNDLIKKGVKASIALISGSNDQLKYYKDPVLFNFVYFDSNESFLSDNTVLPKVVFSTIVWSSPIVAQYASDRNAISAQFVQGYEGFFWNGTRYVETIESYKSTDYIVTTSNWLFNMVSRHISAEQDIRQLPLIINEDIFFSADLPRPVDIIIVFRSSPDKGQWILAELLDRLSYSDKTIVALCASDFSFLKDKYKNRVEFVDLPIDQYAFAKILKKGKVLVDASFHEGYGLIPLEAALCGCDLVLSDSGGVRDFVHQYNGEFIKNFLDYENIIKLINQKLDKFDERKTDKSLTRQTSSGDAWYDYFQEITKRKTLPFFNPNLLTNDTNTYSLTKLSSIDLVDQSMVTTTKPLIEQNADSNGTIKNIYKSFIFPYIPKRVHFALKILISGKI